MIIPITNLRFTKLNVQIKTLYFIQKRYCSGKKLVETGGKKVLEKCVGAGCESLSSVRPQINNPTSLRNDAQTPLSSSLSNNNTKDNEGVDFSMQDLIKETQKKDIEFHTTNVTENEDSKNPSEYFKEDDEKLKRETYIGQQQKENNNKDFMDNSDNYNLNTLFDENNNDNSTYIDSSFVVDDYIGVPSIPSNRNTFQPKVKVFPEGFAQELQEAVLERHSREEEIVVKLTNIDYNIERQRKLNEQENKAYEDCLEKIKQQILKYENLKSSNGWNDEKKTILKDIKALLNNYISFQEHLTLPLSRDLEEFKKVETYIKNINEIWVNPILNCLAQETIKEGLTLEQFKKEQSYLNDVLAILTEYGKCLPEPIFHEIIRRVGVTLNNDAIFKDNSGNTIIIKEGEGSTLHYNSYSIMSKNQEKYFNKSIIALNEKQKEEIFSKLLAGDFILGILKNKDDNHDKYIDSGDELHMNVLTEITNESGESFFISIGHLTSNKDSSTIKLTDKQYINKTEQEVNKEQRFRPYMQFLKLDKEYIEEYKEGSLFITSTNIEEKNIKEIIIESVKLNKELLITNPLRELTLITREKIQDIAVDLIKENILTLDIKINNYECEIINFTENEKLQEEKKRQAQYENRIKNKKEALIKRNAPEDVKHLFNIKDELKKEQKLTKKKNNQ